MTPLPPVGEPRDLALLGSTGSIGVQALEVVRQLAGRLRIVGLAAHSNVELLTAQIAEFRPPFAALLDERAAAELRGRCAGIPCEIMSGVEGLERIATLESAHLVLGAMLGSAGLPPTLAAIRAGKHIALANKETLVAAGNLVTCAARQHGVYLLPVDSEHSALFQCLVGEDRGAIRKLTLTASGGPFVDRSAKTLAAVTRAEALAHPTWRMGNKITIDSATLMNKGLEVIEAHWLFGCGADAIEVVIHRQSIVHSLVEFLDGSVKAQLGIPDMRLPIQYALLFPERLPGPAPPLDLVAAGRLTFEAPDVGRFPCLRLAFEALQAGGTAPAVLNAANEVAVDAFLRDQLDFMGIPRTIERTLERHTPTAVVDLTVVLAADAWARATAREFIESDNP